jgi:hypothetical protein
LNHVVPLVGMGDRAPPVNAGSGESVSSFNKNHDLCHSIGESSIRIRK